MNEMICYSCSKQRAELFAKKSNLIAGVTLLICQSCIDQKFEPRWTIILYARKNGADSVRDYIVKRKYVGEEIKATELIV